MHDLKLTQAEQLMMIAHRKGISNKQIAEYFNWSQGSISMYFSGKAPISRKRVQQLAEYLER